MVQSSVDWEPLYNRFVTFIILFFYGVIFGFSLPIVSRGLVPETIWPLAVIICLAYLYDIRSALADRMLSEWSDTSKPWWALYSGMVQERSNRYVVVGEKNQYWADSMNHAEKKRPVQNVEDSQDRKVK